MTTGENDQGKLDPETPNEENGQYKHSPDDEFFGNVIGILSVIIIATSAIFAAIGLEIV